MLHAEADTGKILGLGETDYSQGLPTMGYMGEPFTVKDFLMSTPGILTALALVSGGVALGWFVWGRK